MIGICRLPARSPPSRSPGLTSSQTIATMSKNCCIALLWGYCQRKAPHPKGWLFEGAAGLAPATLSLSIDRGTTLRLLNLLPDRHPCHAVLGDRHEGFQPLDYFDQSFCVRPLQIPVYLIVPPRTRIAISFPATAGSCTG